MKDFIAKHKKPIIIAGVIVGIIVALLIYGIVMSKKSAPKAKYLWNGEEQKLGELGTDTPLPANVYLTAEGDLRLDFYGVGSNVETESEDQIFEFDSYLDDTLFAENDEYKSSLTVSFLDALVDASYAASEASTETESETEMGTEAQMETKAQSVESLSGELSQEEPVPNIVVPLVEEEDGKTGQNEETKEESYDASKDEEGVAQMAKQCFGISLPYESGFSVQAAGFGVRYEFHVVIDTLGHINVQTIEAKEIDISFDHVEDYSKVAAAFPNLVIPEGVNVQSAVDDYTVDVTGEIQFPSKMLQCKDYKNDEVIYVVMTELEHKDKLFEYFGDIGEDSGTIDANGKKVTIYDAGKFALAMYCDDTASYCIYGYDKDTMKQVVGGYIK